MRWMAQGVKGIISLVDLSPNVAQKIVCFLCFRAFFWLVYSKENLLARYES